MKSRVAIAGFAAGGAAVVAVGAWIAVGVLSVAGIKTPQYTVIEQKDGYEIRRYEPQLAAEVTVNDEFKDALNRGFRILADYIFGANVAPGSNDGSSSEIAMTAPVQERQGPSEKIAMTAPVTESTTDENTHVISFIMPSQYTLQTLPKPVNEAIRIVEIPAQTYAVLRFSGWVGPEKAQKQKDALTELVARDGLATLGEPILSQYNPPWTPPPMRRNEVWIALKTVDGALSAR